MHKRTLFIGIILLVSALLIQNFYLSNKFTNSEIRSDGIESMRGADYTLTRLTYILSIINSNDENVGLILETEADYLNHVYSQFKQDTRELIVHKSNESVELDSLKVFKNLNSIEEMIFNYDSLSSEEIEVLKFELNKVITTLQESINSYDQGKIKPYLLELDVTL